MIFSPIDIFTKTFFVIAALVAVFITGIAVGFIVGLIVGNTAIAESLEDILASYQALLNEEFE